MADVVDLVDRHADCAICCVCARANAGGAAATATTRQVGSSSFHLRARAEGSLLCKAAAAPPPKKARVIKRKVASSDEEASGGGSSDDASELDLEVEPRRRRWKKYKAAVSYDDGDDDDDDDAPRKKKKPVPAKTPSTTLKSTKGTQVSYTAAAGTEGITGKMTKKAIDAQKKALKEQQTFTVAPSKEGESPVVVPMTHPAAQKLDKLGVSQLKDLLRVRPTPLANALELTDGMAAGQQNARFWHQARAAPALPRRRDQRRAAAVPRVRQRPPAL